MGSFVSNLEFGISDLFVIWSLSFGIYSMEIS